MVVDEDVVDDDVEEDVVDDDVEVGQELIEVVYVSVTLNTVDAVVVVVFVAPAL